MDLVVTTMSVVSNSSEDLCCTLPTHLDDPKVNVTDFEILQVVCLKFFC